MKRSTRVGVLVLGACCLAVLAGVLAARAFASGTDYYCQGCTLSSSGVPAVSQAHHPSFFWDGMFTGKYDPSHQYWEAVYFYSANQNRTMCYSQVFTNYGESTPPSCTTGPSDTDARCHLTMGTGPAKADCEAEYSNQ